MQPRLRRKGLEVETRHDRVIVTAHNYSGIVFLIFIGIACMFLFGWVWQGSKDLVLILMGLVILPTFALAMLVLVPRRMVTVFDLDGHRVMQTVQTRFSPDITTTLSFADIASVGAKERYDEGDEGYTYLPVIRLKTGDSFPMGIRGGSAFEAGRVLDAICVATNLPRADIAAT